MILHEPFIITSRLLAGLRVGDSTLSIDYHWWGGGLQEGAESLLSFLIYRDNDLLIMTALCIKISKPLIEE